MAETRNYSFKCLHLVSKVGISIMGLFSNVDTLASNGKEMQWKKLSPHVQCSLVQHGNDRKLASEEQVGKVGRARLWKALNEMRRTLNTMC